MPESGTLKKKAEKTQPSNRQGHKEIQRNKRQDELVTRMYRNKLTTSMLHWKKLADQDAEEYLIKSLSINNDSQRGRHGEIWSQPDFEGSTNTTRKTQYNEEEERNHEPEVTTIKGEGREEHRPGENERAGQEREARTSTTRKDSSHDRE